MSKKKTSPGSAAKDFLSATQPRRPAAYDPATGLPGIAPVLGPLARKI
jgi:hypothetical protein